MKSAKYIWIAGAGAVVVAGTVGVLLVAGQGKRTQNTDVSESTVQESQQDYNESEMPIPEDKTDETDMLTEETEEHTWIDANYQDPKTCSTCGTTEGDPLPAAFDENGYVINTELGGTYNLVAICHDDPSKELTGSLTFSEYETVEEEPLYALEKKEGYEWHILHATAQFTDGNPFTGGAGFCYFYEDFYDIDGWDSSCRDKEIIPLSDYAARTYTVNFHGTDYECEAICYHNIESDATSCTIDFYFYVCTPTGYDGTVVVFGKRAPELENVTIYDVADEDTLYFRMN